MPPKRGAELDQCRETLCARFADPEACALCQQSKLRLKAFWVFLKFFKTRGHCGLQQTCILETTK